MKKVVVKRLLKQESRTLNRQFEDFAGFYGFKPILCRLYRGQTKGKMERTVKYANIKKIEATINKKYGCRGTAPIPEAEPELSRQAHSFPV